MKLTNKAVLEIFFKLINLQNYFTYNFILFLVFDVSLFHEIAYNPTRRVLFHQGNYLAAHRKREEPYVPP